MKRITAKTIKNPVCHQGTAAEIAAAVPCRHDDGVTAIEFAIIAPVFLAILFGMIVYGIYFATWIAITEAASEGARAAVAGLSSAERTSLATAQVAQFFSYYAPLLNSNNATVVAQAAPGSNGGSFQVSISYNFTSYGFSALSGLLPIPIVNPSTTITVSNGG
jgi:Flp pilus assembly protein TadG